MNKYFATVRVSGQLVKTLVFAECSVHARLLLQYQFGMNSIAISPTLATQAMEGYRLLDEVIKSIKPIKPLTPAQARVSNLQRNIERDRDALKAERDSQRRQREAQRQQRRRQPQGTLTTPATR